jgi:hypothetical protein
VRKTLSTGPSAFRRSYGPKTTLAYMGSIMSLFAKGEETGGRFALMEFQSRPMQRWRGHMGHGRNWEN